MARKPVSGFAEAGAAMAQQLDDNDLLNLFTAVGRVVSKRFLMKRPCLDQWQLVIDYLRSAMGFDHVIITRNGHCSLRGLGLM